MTNEELKKKIIDIIHDTEICSVKNDCDICKYGQELMNYKDMSCRTLRAADNLIASGIGDVKEAEHRAEVAERALSSLVHEMYEHDIRPMCDEKFFIESRLIEAEKELAEEGKDENN